MKTMLQFLLLPALCHALVVTDVMAAKKDDDSDSKNKKTQRQVQAKQAPKPLPKKIAKSAPQREKIVPKQVKRVDPAPEKKIVKPKEIERPKPKAVVQDKPRQTEKKTDITPEKRVPKDRPESTIKKPGDKPKLDLDKREKDRTADKARDKKIASKNKAMELPGKRPQVKKVERKEIDVKSAEIRRAKVKTESARIDKTSINKKRVVRPGQNTKMVKRPDFERDRSKAWWDSSKRVRSDTKIVKVTTINNNFRQNVNWSTRRHHWGYNPWWSRPAVRPWYRDSWNWGWSPGYYHRHHYDGWYGGYRPPGYYDDNHVARAIGWGLIGWSLGALAYDTGYRTYYNPYHVRPVYVSEGIEVTYTRPITEVAVQYAPKDDDAVEASTVKSESFIAESQNAFKQRNYLVALELADKAIAATPGDGAIHEYRALILFALGKYGDAAGVLNPVLASGPGWQWSTMIALYDAQQTYTDQLQRLESYSEEKPDAADAHFLLGYHYMVCGHLDLATPQFELAHKLMPSDTVSKELAALTSASADPDAKAEAEPADDEETAEPAPVQLEKLEGTWVSNKEGAGTITLSFRADGKFTWSFLKDGKANEFSGEYSINDDGSLVLDSEESQMVARVEMPEDRQLKFVLAGGPPEDDGLAFQKN